MNWYFRRAEVEGKPVWIKKSKQSDPENSDEEVVLAVAENPIK